MHYIIALSIVSLALIVCVYYHVNHKIINFKEYFKKSQSECNEQAIIDETADEAVAVDVVEVADSAIKKVVKHAEVVEQQKKPKPRKYTRKSQNNAKLRAK